MKSPDRSRQVAKARRRSFAFWGGASLGVRVFPVTSSKPGGPNMTRHPGNLSPDAIPGATDRTQLPVLSVPHPSYGIQNPYQNGISDGR